MIANVERHLTSLITVLGATLEEMNELREDVSPDLVDKRALSVAATHLETAMLWLANARK